MELPYNLDCDIEGGFTRNGNPLKVSFPFTISGRRATARIVISVRGEKKYYQASRLIAMKYKRYSEDSYIIYKDGNIHNISLSNLIVTTDKKKYHAYMMRNSEHKGASLEERKRKLEIIIEEAALTRNYMDSLSFSEINKHVEDYLIPFLFGYCINTLHLGRSTANCQVPNCIARMYEVLMNGMCLYNYERYCKKLLLNYKKKGDFGVTGNVPKPILIEVDNLKLDCLCEKYKVSVSKNKI